MKRLLHLLQRLRFKGIEVLVAELTNRCNADCVYCGRQYQFRKLCDTELDLFKRIVDESGAKTVFPQNWGEPLLHPDFIEAVVYAKRKRKRVIIYTNASLLTRDTAEKLLDTRVDPVNFSVDSYNQETYEPIRRGLS